jgi:hypothetical protein
MASPFVRTVRYASAPLDDRISGGVALNDTSAGLMYQVWTAGYTDGDVWVAPSGKGKTVLFSKPGITELSVAFDVNMAPFAAFADASGSHYWWFDSVSHSYVFSDVDGTSPRCTLDDNRAFALQDADILLFYQRGGHMYLRMQRDRYGVEYDAGAVTGQLDCVGMGKNSRLQLRFLSA